MVSFVKKRTISMTPSVAVLITCFNRKALTLKCIQKVYEQVNLSSVNISIYVVDDNSTDGTYLAIEQAYPDVNLIKGCGSLFWNGGMRLAYSKAKLEEHDYYLWLNDDTQLATNALHSLLACENDYKQSFASDNKQTIVTGATSNLARTAATYGGLKQVSLWQKTKFSLLPSSRKIQQCDTMNGNCVLVPSSVAKALKNLEPQFSHGMGDIDYGLRAKKLGYDVVVAPDFIGICDRNCKVGSFKDTSLPLNERMQHLLSKKGLPLKTWFIFTRRHTGAFWPFYFLWPYFHLVVDSLVNKLKK